MAAPAFGDNENFKQAIMAALRDCAPETNVDGWIGRSADALRVSTRQFKSWLYGDNAPESYSFVNLCGHFGPRFANAFLERAGLRCARLDNCEAIDHANRLARLETALTQIGGVLEDTKNERTDP